MNMRIKNTVKIDGFDIPAKLIGTALGHEMLQNLRAKRDNRLAELQPVKKATNTKVNRNKHFLSENPLRANLILSDGNFLVPTEAQYF